jgi:RES domain-containing protein
MTADAHIYYEDSSGSRLPDGANETGGRWVHIHEQAWLLADACMLADSVIAHDASHLVSKS